MSVVLKMLQEFDADFYRMARFRHERGYLGTTVESQQTAATWSAETRARYEAAFGGE
jgi:hypothetical protein